MVAGFRLKAIESWCLRSVAPGSKVYSDGLPCFGAVATAGCLHAPVVIGGGKASVRVKEFVWLNTVIGNAETANRSTHHSMKGKYAQRYQSEFEHRFNRRYDLPSMVPRLAWAANPRAARPILGLRRIVIWKNNVHLFLLVYDRLAYPL